MNDSAEKNNKSALAYILSSVVLFSTLPLAFVLGGASKAPFIFVGLVWLSSGVCGAGYLFVRYKNKRNIEAYTLIKENI